MRRDIGDYHFIADSQTGLTMRWGKTIKDNPIWAPVPELADISISNHCSKGCSYCYRKSTRNNEFMRVEQYCQVLDSINHPQYGNVFQVAIGGGEPLEHPNFLAIIDATLQRKIVPNFTTNGIFLSSEICNALSGKVGAVALSIDKISDLQRDKIKMLRKYNIRTNIHYVLSIQNINEAIDIVRGKYTRDLEGINAIIFLTYKPAGRAKQEYVLYPSEALQHFIQLVCTYTNKDLKIGFDACFVPNLLHADFKNKELVDVCEAGFFSVYIDHNMNVSPCSFSMGNDSYNLNDYDFYDIWNNKFEAYRNAQQNQCAQIDCPAYSACNGHCPYYPLITTCYVHGN